jgi:hypothetical protein
VRWRETPLLDKSVADPVVRCSAGYWRAAVGSVMVTPVEPATPASIESRMANATAIDFGCAAPKLMSTIPSNGRCCRFEEHEQQRWPLERSIFLGFRGFCRRHANLRDSTNRQIQSPKPFRLFPTEPARFGFAWKSSSLFKNLANRTFRG